MKPSFIPSLALVSVLALSGCAATRTDAATAATPTQASTPSPSSAPDPARDLKAALILKRAADTYRQQMAEGHAYLLAGKTDHFDAWWSYLTQGTLVKGLFVDTARRAYSDAGDLYGQDQYPAPLDAWDDLMDAKGQLVTHATLWHDRKNEAEYQATLNALDQADRLADELAPGATYQPTPVPPVVVDP